MGIDATHRPSLSRRDYLFGSAASLVLAPRPERRLRSRPNLVLFMPDQLRAESIGCYGHPLVRTPNIDRLAASGVRFACCQSAYPVCTASRCNLLTGWPPHVRWACPDSGSPPERSPTPRPGRSGPG